MPLPERKLIERIRSLAPRAVPPLIETIGDDCAVLRPRRQYDLLVTTDLSIEDTHFRRQWHPAPSVGHRCLARGLSDIAAMGGEPVACFLSLGLPPRLSQAWVDGFLRGLTRLARSYKVQLSGGDISSAPKIVADIVVLGQVARGASVLRSGAKPGDRIFVTGELGGSANVLRDLFAGKRVRPATSSRHFYPAPRIAVGRWLQQRQLVTAMIDLSDGLSVDLAHLCDESRVAATVRESAIPIAKRAGLELALHGGEDYELLFTARPKAKIPARIAGVKVTEIGAICRQENYGAAISILNDNGHERALQPKGWQHFAKT